MFLLTRFAVVAAFAFLCALAVPAAHADVVADWNDTACEVVGKVGPGAPGHRLMAVVQSAVFEAVNAIEPRVAGLAPAWSAPRGASLEAAVAAANRATLVALVPSEKAAIETAYQAAIDAVPAGEARAQGIAAGERAAALMLARAAADGAHAPERYQWQAEAGRYVPTALPAATTWPARQPWVMQGASQFRPPAHPALASETWLRDLAEVRALGAKASTTRSPAQTEIARFWEETRPLVYFPLLRAVAALPGRSVADNARLYAAAALANDDALIAVFDAKYHHRFWRPIAAIRAGDAADAGWTPLVATPLHPEYPCAHCALAGAMKAVIDDELRGRPLPPLRTSSPTLPGVVHEWSSTDALVQEVQLARIAGGVHYRNSTRVGAEMGIAVGQLVQRRFAPAREQ